MGPYAAPELWANPLISNAREGEDLDGPTKRAASGVMPAPSAEHCHARQKRIRRRSERLEAQLRSLWFAERRALE
jgi:hypothetical protein